MVAQPVRSLTRRWAPGFVGVVGLLVLAGACDKMPLVAPSGTAITLIASTNVLPVNGSVEITAVLIEGGQTTTGTGQNQQTTTSGVGTPVHNGTLVSFTTTLGKIEPAEARTTAGKATVRLIADGRSGTATVSAFSGGSSKTLDVAVGAAGAARIIVTANPQTLPSNGGTATVIARVEDAQGNGLLGVPVSFSTTAGTLSATSGLSNDQGLVSTILTAAVAATVKASAGGGTGAGSTLTGEVAITVQAPIDLRLTPPTGAVTVSAPAIFTVEIGQNSRVTNVVLDFGDGTDAPLGALTGSTSVPHLYGREGIFTVRATATGTDGSPATRSSQVAVGAFEVTINPVGSVIIDTPVTFTATVTPSVTQISRYEWDFGDGTTGSGRVTSHVYSLSAVGTRTVTVRAIPVSGGSQTAMIQVQIKER